MQKRSEENCSTSFKQWFINSWDRCEFTHYRQSPVQTWIHISCVAEVRILDQFIKAADQGGCSGPNLPLKFLQGLCLICSWHIRESCFHLLCFARTSEIENRVWGLRHRGECCCESAEPQWEILCTFLAHDILELMRIMLPSREIS